MAVAATDTRALRLWRLAAVLLVLLCAAIYVPGLSGGFLFDDHANLPALGSFGPVDNLQGLLLYLFSGIADPTGRPLSMLSFLIDARDWPAEPFGFKRTNVCIHLANALLLVALLDRLGARAGLDRRHALSAAVLAGAAWALHPLWVSSVLYIVQRHALLAASFVFGGLLLWLAAERAFEARRALRGWCLALAAIGACGLAAGLCKPNGFLLPVLALAVLPVGARPQASAGRWPRRTLLLLPAILLVAALAYAGLTGDAEGRRPWSIGERLLTQPRVLLDYLRLLLLPDAHSAGVFADDYRVSTSAWQPATTLPAAALVLAGAIVALRWRRSPWACALLFFLAGHLLESTVLPLELYFEHRNYLPAALLFWPLGIALTAPGAAPRWRLAGAAAGIGLLAGFTLMRAALWGDPLALALNWSRDYPHSARAQAHAVGELVARGHLDIALARLEPLFAEAPLETQYALAVANIRCLRGDVDKALLQRVGRALADKGLAPNLNYDWMVDLVLGRANSPCATLDLESIGVLVHSLPEGSDDEAENWAGLRLRGHFAIRSGRCDEALAIFDRRLDIRRRPEDAIEQIGYLASQCSPALAYRHLAHYRAGAARGFSPLPCCALRVRDWLMQRNGYWEREIDRLEAVLREDLGLVPTAR